MKLLKTAVLIHRANQCWGTVFRSLDFDIACICMVYTNLDIAMIGELLFLIKYPGAPADKASC